jgi:hypothetical protein
MQCGSPVSFCFAAAQLMTKCYAYRCPPCLQVAASAFDLLFAFDEVISLGHKENVTVAQVRQCCSSGGSSSCVLEPVSDRSCFAQ